MMYRKTLLIGAIVMDMMMHNAQAQNQLRVDSTLYFIDTLSMEGVLLVSKSRHQYDYPNLIVFVNEPYLDSTEVDALSSESFVDQKCYLYVSPNEVLNLYSFKKTKMGDRSIRSALKRFYGDIYYDSSDTYFRFGERKPITKDLDIIPSAKKQQYILLMVDYRFLQGVVADRPNKFIKGGYCKAIVPNFFEFEEK